MINFKETLLYILSRLNGQRTAYAAYHILQGKKSAQTIQDIHLFQLRNAYGILPQLRKEVYSKWVDECIKEGYIKVDPVSFSLTEKGKTFIDFDVLDPLIYFNGFKYHRIDQKWFSTLQLLMQSLSNLSYKNKRFIPITDDFDVQNQVKRLLTIHDHSLLAGLLKHELELLLNQCDEVNANIFTIQLSGYKRIGLNQMQVSDLFQLNVEDVQLITKAVIHDLLGKITREREQYPILSELIIDDRHTSLTSSAQQTYNLLKKGRNIKEVEHIRHLKESTIHDHIIEIATQVDNFDIAPYIDLETIKRIIQVVNQTNTKRLKSLMEKLDHSVTYFELRLVLAKYHTYKESVVYD